MTTPLRVPGSFAIPSVAPVYADGIPVAQAQPAAASSPPASQRFWSSQPRLAGDPTVEELAVSLGQDRIVNYVAVDLPRFPHVAAFFWWDGSLWQPLAGSSGAPLSVATSGSVPAMVDSPVALDAGLNPYHYGAGHWAHHDEQVQPVVTSRLLLRLTRAAPAPWQQVPLGPSGHPVPYPLGAMNLDVGTRVLSSSDVPPMPRSPSVPTLRQPFTTTADLNGSPVTVQLRENRAVGLLGGLPWRCAPQPASSCVVQLYLDSRDANGNPQVTDRIFIDPVTSGVRMSIYWSPSPPPPGASFAALDDPVPPGLITTGGTVPPSAVAAGISFPAQPGWLTVPGQASGTIASSPWWAGIELMPSFASTDQGTYVILDTSVLTLTFSAGTWAVTLPGGGTAGTWSFSFAPGDRLAFAFGQDGLRLFCWAPAGAMFQAPLALPLQGGPAFCFGGLLQPPGGIQVLAGNYTLTAFVVKQEALGLSGGIPADLAEFAAGPGAYVTPPLAGSQATTANAVLRFAPPLILPPVSPWGFAGGLGGAYEACAWVPVRGSFTLARGYVQLEPVLAAAWKLEFTGLQPEPYEYLRPVTATARLPPLPPDGGPPAGSAPDAGLQASAAISAATFFPDTPAAPRFPPAGTVLPTEALYAPDLAAASALALRGGSLYNMQPWQPPAAAAPAQLAGPTACQEADYAVISRVAYFVALSAVALFRVSYTATADTEQYVETFSDPGTADPATITPGGWALQPGTGLVLSGNVPPGGAQVRSLVLPSAHAVTGVQFATVQSGPAQLLPDADFSGPSFGGWLAVGDALPLSLSPQQAQLGAMAQVTRGASPAPGASAQPVTWGALQPLWGTWAGAMAAVPAWLDIGLAPASTAMGGIAWTGPPVTATGSARAYAAARVFSPAALSAPLFLQLLDGATGMVIAEAEQAVAGGSVTEWLAGFTMGQGIVSSLDWAQVASAYPAWAAIGAVTWAQADTSTAPLGTTLTVQLIQKESTGDAWSVDNISIFQDSVLWEFSNDGGATWCPAYDVRNDPHGVLSFPPAAPGQGAQLMWRATAWQPGTFISSLAIRPWYATWPHGVPARAAGVGHGPNLAPLDRYGTVDRDPRWQAPSGPLPSDWFFATRQALGVSSPASDFPGPPQPPPDAVLGSALAWEPPAAQGQEPQAFTDIFTDIFTDTYAPGGAGDVYADPYADGYGADYQVLTGTVRPAAAALAAPASLAAAALVIPVPAWGLGADLGPVPASDPSVAALLAATGLPLPARRIALGNVIPASLASSLAAGDAGVRRVLLDFRPDATTTPARLGAFLASCQAGGLQASVSIWAGADSAFINPADWLAMLPGYAAVIRQNGYRHVVTVSAASVDSGWLQAWYPGDDLVDVIAPTFFCTGPPPGSGAATLAASAAFADAHGKPLGLAGTGVNLAAFTAAQGEAFTAYLASFFASRRAAGKPGSDAYWLGTGGYSVTTAPPAMLAAYQALAAVL